MGEFLSGCADVETSGTSNVAPLREFWLRESLLESARTNSHK